MGDPSPDNLEKHKHDFSYQKLSEDEPNELFEDLDQDNDSYVDFDELKAKLEDVHPELAPQPKRHHLHHPARWNGASSNTDPEKGIAGEGSEHDGPYVFLDGIKPDCTSKMDRKTFISHVDSCNIPSRTQTSFGARAEKDSDQEQHLPWTRRLRAHWSVEGPQIIFALCVIILQLSFAIWQLVSYLNKPRVRVAVDWGAVVSKAAAGVLYPTLSIIFISMSRWFVTAMRRFYHISRVIIRSYPTVSVFASAS